MIFDGKPSGAYLAKAVPFPHKESVKQEGFSSGRGQCSRAELHTCAFGRHQREPSYRVSNR